MSAFFSHTSGNSREWLAATITAGAPASNEDRLITCWAKWNNVNNVGGAALTLECDGEDGYVQVFAAGTNIRGKFKHEGGGNVNSEGLGFSTNTWHFMAAYMQAPSTGFRSIKSYIDSTQYSNSVDTTSITALDDFNKITVGNDDSPEEFSRWEGWVEDVAVWVVTGQTQADTIVSQLYNSGSGKRADNITESTPSYYAPLISDASVLIGTGALSQQGAGTGPHEVTFDAGETPGLAAGGGGAAVQHVGHFV